MSAWVSMGWSRGRPKTRISGFKQADGSISGKDAGPESQEYRSGQKPRTETTNAPLLPWDFRRLLTTSSVTMGSGRRPGSNTYGHVPTDEFQIGRYYGCFPLVASGGLVKNSLIFITFLVLEVRLNFGCDSKFLGENCTTLPQVIL